MTGEDPRGGRPQRADARRNYQHLLDQAKIAFAEFGADASLDEISRRAGVASGTLYRHFPTRMDLIEAVLADRIGELVNDGRGLLHAEDAVDALFTWLTAAVEHGVTYRGLSAAVMNSALDRGSAVISKWHKDMFDVGAQLLARAQASGAIVADVEAADVLKMVSAIAWAAQGDSAQASRLLTLSMNGLRARPGG
ncbi:helix-turn-helix domain-containing protein [Actinocrispum sp. NPDC049592]|uniref:TetR/AcrR family transcriptional regulator n=1 Tax=Actinocrispum sp. NPDC049592 TaxID=3154835 RepID=UPI00342BE5BE